MSYDFELYTSGRHLITEPPSVPFGNVSLDGPDRFELDDVPETYFHIIGKKRWLYRIHLEGEIAHGDQRRIDDWLRTIVLESRGVLIDLQTEKYETPTLSGRIEPEEERPTQMGAMVFYFEDGEGFYERGFKSMLQKIEDVFPRALPTRYGEYEPLQGRLEKGKYSEITKLFRDSTEFFMKSPTPFGYVYMAIPCKKQLEAYPPSHSIHRDFLMGCVEFELRANIFEKPVDLASLLLLFKELSVQLNVAYAEILPTEQPENAWFWSGLPDRKSAHTICVGPAYLEIWKEAAMTGEALGKRHRIFTTDRFGNKPPRPPAVLLAPAQKGPGSG